jgi:glycosyltransferase involved in cell wall biosynthesis
MQTNSALSVAIPTSAANALRPEGEPLTVASLSSVHVANSYLLGGVGRVFAELCRCLPAAGVRFAGAVAEPDDVQVLSDGRVQLFASSTAGMKTRLKNGRHTLLQLIETERADILASHFALYAAPMLDKLSRRRGYAFVNHFHGPWAAESVEEGAAAHAALVKKYIERFVYHRADRVVVLSRAFARVAAEQYRISEDRIRIVPGSVDTERFNMHQTSQEARRYLGLPVDRPLLLSVRRLVRRMGLHSLVESMREVSRAIPDARLLIAGTGPLQESLKTAIAEFGLQDKVHLLGFVPDEQLPLLYRAVDLNVVPSQALEGFGLVAVEALAAGTPSVVTPVGGLPEIVSGLSPSLIFSSPAPTAMATRIVELLNGSIRLPTQKQCRDLVLQNYTSELMAERTADVYREVA